MTTRFITLAAVMTAVLAAACARDDAAPAASASVAAAPLTAPEASPAVIEKLESDWVKAIVGKDTATIERLVADDFVGTTGDTRYHKSDAVEDVKTGTHESLDISDTQVRLYGNTAVVTFQQDEKSHHGKDDFSGHYLFTNVWVNKDGVWRAVASHGSRIR